MAKVDIFPYFDAFNQSFFLHSLLSVFGPRNIQFTTKGFPDLRTSGSLKLIIQGEQARRIFIDHWDLPRFHEPGLEWCDVYAKRNIDPCSIPQQHAEKVMAIGPSFPLRACDTLRSVQYSFRTFALICSGSSRKPFRWASAKEHFANWYGQLAMRLPLDDYKPGPSCNDYIFFCGTLWKKDGAANDSRAMFIRACKEISGVRFEGGLSRRSDIPLNQDLMIDQWFSQSQYLEKTKASAVVFNNPAVARCHSWRLGEALALGKAIVSLPIERMLPSPLVHGENVHFVNASISSMKDAIERIVHDSAYRARLEKGARQYYLRYLSPSAVVQRLQGVRTTPPSVLPARQCTTECTQQILT